VGERSIARYLKGFLGPAKRYQVHIDRQGTDLFKGSISHFTVAADDLSTLGGLKVRHLDADLYGVRFDPKAKTLQSIERSSFTASVDEASANAYLSTHDRGLPELSVQFEPEQIVVKALPKVLGVSIPLTLRGSASVEGGNRIRFTTDTLAVSRLNVPRIAVRLVEQHVNPVFDLDELRLPARLAGAMSRSGELILTGEVMMPTSF
jgi:hypothetical protein